MILSGLRSLGKVGTRFYSAQKQEAKANAALTYIGEEKVGPVESQLIAFNEKNHEVTTKLQEFDFLKSPADGVNHWLNFHGIHDVPLIERAGDAASLERLTLRQILDSTQRPKVEQYDHYLFLSVKSITKSDSGILDVEQISFALGKQSIITFQEKVGDHFDDIREKMEKDIGFIRKRGCDYLLSQLLDAVLDNFFETFDKMNEEISDLEKEIYANPTKASLIALEVQKGAAQLIKKSLNPLREALQSLMNNQSKLIREENFMFYKDLSSSTITAIEEAESLLRSLEGLSNIYFASLSQNMNEVMKVLTTVATIFIPLTFIAGIYGMNFDYIPELKYRYGYFTIWGVMVVVTIGMIIYFRRKKWI